MANPKKLVRDFSSATAGTIEEVYKSPLEGAGSVVTAFTATNATTQNRIHSVYIFGADGILTKKLISDERLIRNKSSFGGEIVNQALSPGETIRVESDLADSISWNISGKEFVQ
jgi:hypothetical protein